VQASTTTTARAMKDLMTTLREMGNEMPRP
jgi:hypothetical protein